MILLASRTKNSSLNFEMLVCYMLTVVCEAREICPRWYLEPLPGVYMTDSQREREKLMTSFKHPGFQIYTGAP